MDKKNKVIYINFSSLIILIVFTIILVFSVKKIYVWGKDNRENQIINNEINNIVMSNENKDANNDEEIKNIDTIDNIDNNIFDFNILKEKNPDVVGWIEVLGTNIKYSVVKAKNNDFYLNHNFNKEYNSSGWIFADYKNKLDGTDKNIVIYGHNVRDNSMFGSLKNILTEEWYNNENNYVITFRVGEEEAIYRVFSVYKIEVEDYYIQTDFNKNSFEKFIKTIKNRSIKKFSEEVNENDSILTLSTCANNNKYRIVLHAKKISI